MIPSFLDSGYVIALEARNDQHHQEAVAHWENLSASRPPLVTTTLVICEVVNYFQGKNQHAKSVEMGTWLMGGDEVQLERVDEALFLEGWEYLVRHRDKSYSLTDCVSFVLMNRLGIRAALTFDHHFVQAGFERHP
jgi:predicted nucleic acid-binding protein